jgi:glycogen operon protein
MDDSRFGPDTANDEAPLAAGPQFRLRPGRPHPLGATPDETGCNFSLFSQHAKSVTLLLFDRHDAVRPMASLSLDPAVNRSFHLWHAHVEGVRPGMQYAFRVGGPDAPELGLRFDSQKVLIDPYARANTRTLWQRAMACAPGDNVAASLRSVVVDTRSHDWQGDRPLARPMAETIIYEMHVGGFTRHPSSGVRHPGTFSGVVEKIPYLKALGVTAVELLPVFEFDDTTCWTHDGRTLRNYWGYSPIGFFAPHPGYCVGAHHEAQVAEFRAMVRALHAAGIEVILDVVYNHTEEGNHDGPVISFKGLANDVFYHLDPQDPCRYADFSGCGNAVNANHPVPQKVIIDSLRYWVEEMHVDGFRFDLASALSRGEDGAPMAHPPVLWQIELDDRLAETKLIAEAWDAAGLYQVGHFPGARWAEWNGRFRDDMRRFLRGEAGMAGQVAARLTGSADLYQRAGRAPINSINFITAHDGFTLNDLFSYEAKRNAANGEGGRDGTDDNLGWNCGAEGPSDDPAVEALRDRMAKNACALLMLSQGVPMILMGDEVRRSQQGNNNTWCQDNETAWFDWTLTRTHAGMLRFWQRMIAFRKRHPALHRNRYFGGAVNERGVNDFAWHGTELWRPDWSDSSRTLAFCLGGFDGQPDLHVAINMWQDPLSFRLPPVPGRRWGLAVDTGRESPLDIAEPGFEAPVGDAHIVGGRSVAVFLSQPAGTVSREP